MLKAIISNGLIRIIRIIIILISWLCTSEKSTIKVEVVLTFYFVKIERNSYLCISEPSFKFLSCTKYWTKIQ